MPLTGLLVPAVHPVPIVHHKGHVHPQDSASERPECGDPFGPVDMGDVFGTFPSQEKHPISGEKGNSAPNGALFSGLFRWNHSPITWWTGHTDPLSAKGPEPPSVHPAWWIVSQGSGAHFALEIRFLDPKVRHAESKCLARSDSKT